MRLLLKTGLTLAVIVGLLAAIDLGVRILVENQIASAVEAEDELQVDDVEVSIDSFPFLGKLALTGEVSSTTIDLVGLTDPNLEIERLSISADGIVFDRNDLAQGTVRVTSVDSVAAEMVVTQEAASAAVGVPVVFGQGTIGVETAAGVVSTSVAVVDAVVTFTAPGVGELSIELPLQDYLPCPPSALAEPGRIVLSCTAEQLPQVLLDAIGPQQLG